MRLRLFTALAAAAVLALAGVGRTDDAKVNLKVGDKAPAFEGTDEQGKALKSSDHVGKKIVVVYFFPAAFTGG
jgi:thioredoxin-dependent peroxiredoxin